MKNQIFILFVIFSCISSCKNGGNEELPMNGTINYFEVSPEELESEVLTKYKFIGGFQIKPGADSIVDDYVYSSQGYMVYCAVVSDLQEITSLKKDKSGTSIKTRLLERKLVSHRKLMSGAIGDCQRNEFKENGGSGEIIIRLFQDRNRSEKLQNDSIYLSINGTDFWTLPFKGYSIGYHDLEKPCNNIEKYIPAKIINGNHREHATPDSVGATERINHVQIGYLSYDENKKYDFDEFFKAEKVKSFILTGRSIFRTDLSSYEMK